MGSLGIKHKTILGLEGLEFGTRHYLDRTNGATSPEK